mgnify:CR=1 FL=1
MGLPIKELDEQLQSQFTELNYLYSEMVQKCFTDYNEYKYHNNQVYNVRVDIAAMM